MEKFDLINPYMTGRPIQDPAMFFGREDVIRRIVRRLGPDNIIILYGQRRTGKTSTLFHLKNVVYREKAIPVFLTMQSMMGSGNDLFFFSMANEVYDAMRTRTRLPAPKREEFLSDPHHRLETFLRSALEEAGDKPIIFMIDEFDGLFEMIGNKKMDPAVLGNLRAIMQHLRGVWLLLAGTHALKETAADDTSTLFDTATCEKIGLLDENSARNLILEPLKGQIEYEPHAVDEIISLTNRHPYFINGICFELVNYLEKNQSRVVSMKVLNTVIDGMLKLENSHFDIFWPYLSDDEQLFLSLLSENIREYESFIPIDRVRDFCRGNVRAGFDIDNVVEKLVEKDLLIEKRVMNRLHVGFFMKFFKQWLLMHHPSNVSGNRSKGKPQ